MRISIEAFLERQPLIAIQQMYDATILITMLFQAFTHDDIGLMRIEADIADLGFAIIQSRVQNAM